jgi:colicin import membrane protein
MQPNRSEQNAALALTLLLHAGAVLLLFLSSGWLPRQSDEAAAGKPVMATLMVSSADVERARQAMARPVPDDQAEPEPVPERPQPLPEPNPQTSDDPLQMTPQERLDKPDTVDQQEISRLAMLKAEQEREEQERRQRQAQIELTEEIAKAQEAERRQRLREQLEAIRREKEQAAKRTRMEEQRLQQLADRNAVPEPRPGPTPAAPNTGSAGTNDGLRSRYIAAVNATARANWNTLQATQLVRCQVRFFQYTGGNVYKVEFMDCPYDPEAREDVERALMKTAMPYAGFEPVFSREFTMTFCYPEEACVR